MSTEKEYQIVNGTAYSSKTDQKVIDVLERVRASRERIILEYGDTLTGKGWGDIHDVTGYVGRSTGSVKIPLLVYNARCTGGGAILDHCIVNIVTAKGKRVLYSHPNYVTGRV